MKSSKFFLSLVTHTTVAVAGFGIGVYSLPIMIAPPAPSDVEIISLSKQATFTAQFHKDLKDSDMLHWGEGSVWVAPRFVALKGKLAPGPDYKLYLSPSFIETEAEFNQLKSTMVQVGDIRTFDNFMVDLPANVDISAFNTIIVWCEAFGQFITSAKYRNP